MAAQAKLTGYQLFIGVVTTVSGIALAVIFTQMLWQASTLGTHGEKLTGIEQDIAKIERSAPDLEKVLNRRFDELEATILNVSVEVDRRIDALEDTVKASALNLPEIIAKLGVVSEQDIMHAMIYQDSLYAIPANPEAAERFVRAGMHREMIGEAVSAFKVMPVSAITPQQ